MRMHLRGKTESRRRTLRPRCRSRSRTPSRFRQGSEGQCGSDNFGAFGALKFAIEFFSLAVPARAIFRTPLAREDQGCRRWSRHDLHGFKACLPQPIPVIRLPIGAAFLCGDEHLRGKEHREWMAGAIVVENEVVDDEDRKSVV